MDPIGSLLSLLGLGKVISPVPQYDYKNVWATPTPMPSTRNVPTPTPTPTPNPPISPDVIARGMSRFSPSPVPMASMSGQLAQAGVGLPDPLLPAVVHLMETGGGQHMASQNNPYNIGPGVSYPDLKTAILGGDGQRGFSGVVHGPLYEKYRQSGDLKDFFNSYTPPGPQYGNPTMEELLSRYHALRSLFH